MQLVEVILMAVGLSMDACAVSMAAAASGLSKGKRAAFRLSFHFGLFQFLMPVTGWFLGTTIAPYISTVDHWIAFTLLSFVGGKMIFEGGGKDGGEKFTRDPSRGLNLVVLSVATSIDALAIGLSLAMLGAEIWYPSVLIGLITGTLSLVAIKLGGLMGVAFGKRMELFGGVVLIGIGIKVLAEHIR